MNAKIAIDELEIEVLANEARNLMDAVGEHRQAGMKLLERIVETYRELEIAVPDEGDLRFDCFPYEDGISSILAAVNGLEVGLKVPDDLSGADYEWQEIDRLEAATRVGATQPSEV